MVPQVLRKFRNSSTLWFINGGPPQYCFQNVMINARLYFIFVGSNVSEQGVVGRRGMLFLHTEFATESELAEDCLPCSNGMLPWKTYGAESKGGQFCVFPDDSWDLKINKNWSSLLASIKRTLIYWEIFFLTVGLIQGTFHACGWRPMELKFEQWGPINGFTFCTNLPKALLRQITKVSIIHEVLRCPTSIEFHTSIILNEFGWDWQDRQPGLHWKVAPTGKPSPSLHHTPFHWRAYMNEWYYDRQRMNVWWLSLSLVGNGCMLRFSCGGPDSRDGGGCVC